MDVTTRETSIKETYQNTKNKCKKYLSMVSIILIVVAVASLCIGSVFIGPMNVLRALGHALFPAWIDSPGTSSYIIVTSLRLPRIFLAILTGIALGIAGAVMQSTLRNPLVSPFTLGMSSAAGFGAALAIVLGPVIFGTVYTGSIVLFGQYFQNSNLILILFAFLFSVLSMLIVLKMGKQGMSRSTLILGGVVIGYLFTAGVSFLKYVTSDDKLRDIVVWLMGGMWGANWGSVIILTPIVIICCAYLISKATKFNAMVGGDDVAKTQGIDVHKFRNTTLMVVTLCTSACIAFTGIIGFIGLMAPHICRILIGNDHRYLLIGSALTGAAILLMSDTVARTILSPIELPVGIIMYVIGGIFFIYLITSRRGKVIE